MRFGFGAFLIVLGLGGFAAQQSTGSPLESIGRNLESLGATFAVLRILALAVGCVFIGLGCALLRRDHGERFE